MRGQPENHLWVIDLLRGTPTRLTFGPHVNQDGRWSPDGKRIVFHSNRGGAYKMYVKQPGGSSEAEITGITTGWQRPIEWSRDGRFITFDGLEKTTGFDIWYVEMTNPPKATPYLATPANEIGGTISPDGRWIAYLSNESGSAEVYVQSFPQPGTKYQIPRSAGAIRVRWIGNGAELRFSTGNGDVYAVPVTPGEALEFGATEKLATVPDSQASDAAPDGERLVTVVPDDSASTHSLTLVLNWTAAASSEAKR